LTLLILETREIAEEGLKVVQTKVGTTAYLENFNAVRQDVLGKRSIEVITDPERAAKKKIRQHDKVYDHLKSADLSGKGKQKAES
jgi:hypothetical protein